MVYLDWISGLVGPIASFRIWVPCFNDSLPWNTATASPWYLILCTSGFHDNYLFRKGLSALSSNASLKGQEMPNVPESKATRIFPKSLNTVKECFQGRSDWGLDITRVLIGWKSRLYKRKEARSHKNGRPNFEFASAFWQKQKTRNLSEMKMDSFEAVVIKSGRVLLKVMVRFRKNIDENTVINS